MKTKTIIASLMIAFGFTANAQHGNSSFTLKGRSLEMPGQECFLYVDKFGYDESLSGTNKFYAEVRTSYEPTKTLLLVAHPRMRFQMVSLDRFGNPSNELAIRLRGPASEQTLYRATDYHGYSRTQWEGPWRQISCRTLGPIK